MTLDIVNHHFLHTGSSSAILRSFIDMPMTPGKLCLIRQVQVSLIQLDNTRQFFDSRFAISVDPDHVLQSMTILDSTIFLSGSYEVLRDTSASFNIYNSPRFFFYPEGIRCPYTRLPFFVQNSNTNAQDSDWNVRVLFEFVPLTAAESAIAVMRRGRGVTRRVP